MIRTRERKKKKNLTKSACNKKMLVGLVLVVFLGNAFYLLLCTIDYSISSDEGDLLRRQFDLASREAMDESAEWRLYTMKKPKRLPSV